MEREDLGRESTDRNQNMIQACQALHASRYLNRLTVGNSTWKESSVTYSTATAIRTDYLLKVGVGKQTRAGEGQLWCCRFLVGVDIWCWRDSFPMVGTDDLRANLYDMTAHPIEVCPRIWSLLQRSVVTFRKKWTLRHAASAFWVWCRHCYCSML